MIVDYVFFGGIYLEGCCVVVGEVFFCYFDEIEV